MAVDYSKYHSILDSYEPYQPPAAPDAAAPKQNTSTLADFGTDLKRGVQQVPSALTGLLDIPVAAVTGRPMVSEGWDELGKLTGFQPKKWSDEAQAEYSPARQDAQRQAAQAEGFVDTAGVYLSNPSMLAGTVLESVPSIALGGIYARGLKGVGALSGVTRAGIGEGAVMGGQSMNQMVEDGVDPRTAAGFAAGVGAIGGALGVVGGSLAQRMGLIDPDSLAAGVTRTATGQPMGLARRVAGGAVSEGLFEELPQTMVETVAGNLAAERAWDEDLGKNAAVGLLAGSLMGGVVNIPGARRPRDLTQDAPQGEQTVEPSALEAALRTDTVPVQQWIDQQLNIGASPSETRKNAQAAFQGKIEPQLILDENGAPKTTTSAFDVYEFQRDFDARVAKQGGTGQTPVAPQADRPTAQDTDPAVSSLRDTQYAQQIFKQDGAMRQNAERAWQAYRGFSGAEIDAAIEELAPNPGAAWRIAMLETIRDQRTQQAQPEVQDGQPAQVDAAGDQRPSAVAGGSAGDVSGQPDVGNGVGDVAGTPASSSGARAPLGAAVAQSPAGVAERLDASRTGEAIREVLLGTDAEVLVQAVVGRPDLFPKIKAEMSPAAWRLFSEDVAAARQGAPTQNVSEPAQVAPQAQEARGQEGAADVEQARPTHRNQVAPDEVQIPKLPQVQQQVFDYMTQAVRESRMDDIVDAEGTFQYAKIGAALGKKRGSIKAAVDGAVRRIAQSQGLSVEQFQDALRQRAVDDRRVTDSDYSTLGLSPDQQISVADNADVFGNDEGVSPSMEIVDSPAKTNSAGLEAETLGGTAEGDVILREAGALTSRGLTEVENTVDPVAERRAAEAQARRDQLEAEMAALNLEAEMTLAEVNWDSTVEDAENKIRAPKFAGLPSEAQLEFALVSREYEAGGIDEATMVDEVRAIAVEVRSNGYPQDARPAESRAVAQATGAVQSPAVERAENSGRETAGQEAGTGEEVTPSNPLEARVAALRELGLGDKQTARLDKLVRRYQNREIDTERLGEELQMMEEQAFPEDRGGKGMRFSRNLTDTQAFKDWFGDSKMVSRDGTPLTFMHGSPETFDAFDNDRLGEGTNHGSAGLGHFFTRNQSVAERYADGGNIYKGWLAIQRPYRMPLSEAQSFETAEDSARRREQLRRRGHDGVVILDDQNKPWAFVAFEPWQFKSTDNRGTFDAFDDGFRRSAGGATQGTTVESVRTAINAIATPAGRRKITVVQSADELIERGVLNSNEARGTQGFVDGNGNAYFIAENIPQGSELAVVLHEIGAHIGIENLLTPQQYENLTRKIFDWAQSDGNGQEARIARAALARVDAANLTNDADIAPETIAYFIEEAVKAGVNPTAMQYKTELGRWFRTVWAAFKVALRRLNLINADRLTAQNVVDLAYGAARVSLSGQYHGTAANFRRFDHRFMGSGEGAQAFGWGTYLAQRFGIANEYFEADVRRKDRRGDQYLTYDGKRLPDPYNTVNPTEIAQNALAMVSQGLVGNAKGYIDSLFVNDAVAAEAMEVYPTLDPKKVKWVKEGRPEGNIHITDINATEDELLDWDKPLSEQSPQVREALETAVIDGKKIGWRGAEADGWTGKRAYEFFGSRLGSDKAASEYLDSLGIKGIKFLDAMSRGKRARTLLLDGKTYTTDDLLNAYGDRNHPLNDAAVVLRKVLSRGVDSTEAELQAQVDRTIEAFVNAERESAAKFEVPYNEAEARADATARAKNSLYGRELEWLQKNKSRIQIVEPQATRNLVIFNDANIYRVGSMRGGPVDKGGRMMFSKAVDPQLAEQAQEVGSRVVDAIKVGMRKGWTGLAFSADLANAAYRAGIKSARALDLVSRKKATRAHEIQIEVEAVLSQFADLKSHQRAVEEFVYKSTLKQKWGFKPDWKSDAVVDPTFEAEFNKLPKAAQDVVKAVFRHGDTVFRKKQTLLRRTIASEYENLIAAEKDDAKRRSLEKQRDKELREAGRLMNELEGPYAPLRRYGEYVVVAKSQKYRDTEAAGQDTSKLKADPKHYVVEFAETRFEADKRKAELARDFGDGVWAGEKEAAMNRVGEMPFMLVQRLRKMVDSDLDGELNTKSKRVLNKLLVDLYISTLHEANARHSEQRRRYVAGASNEMMRAFATQGRADSHLLSSLEFNDEIVSQLQNVREEAKRGAGDPMLKTRLRNEILQRHMMDLDFEETPLQDKLMSLNSFWMLLTSPAYYVQNATQVFMMTMPVIAAKHNLYASSNALVRASREAWNVLRASSWNEAADLSKFKGTQGERDMLTELQARGTLDFGISAELGYWETRGEVSKVFNQVMRKVGMATRKLEVLNRMSSALAAYRLEYDKASGTDTERHAKALEYADKIIKDTHGDYSTANAPRYLRMLPKVMTQFRKFQLIQLSLFAKNVHSAFIDKGVSADERKVARAALGYLFLNHTMMAGAVGMPASALVGMIYGALAGDDDDPADWEVDVRRAIGDKELADLILHGLPSLVNINMSNKIGAGTMLSPLPFAQFEGTRDGYNSVVVQAMGPLIGGLGPQVWDAVGRMADGDVAQGAAQLLPRGLRDAARGLMASQEGVKLRNGQTALKPEELTFYDSLMMTMGLPTLKTTSRTETQFKAQQYEQFFRERVSRLKREYTEAYEENDRAAMQEARDSWVELQASRKELGFKVQPLSDLLKAPREKAKAERKLESGVRTTEQARGFVQSLQ